MFSCKYNVTNLLYYETFNDIKHAIQREKQLKSWQKHWKLELVKTKNPLLESIKLGLN